MYHPDSEEIMGGIQITTLESLVGRATSEYHITSREKDILKYFSMQVAKCICNITNCQACRDFARIGNS